jgi:hypothetical protein
MSAGDDLATRKAELIAQCDLDRMRLEHALLVTRQSMSPFGSGGLARTMAGKAFGFALPLFARTRRSGVLRFAALALSVIRAVRGYLRR